ncbi:hypothetical protein ABLN67_02440, partial [Mycobacterium tuberculosis]
IASSVDLSNGGCLTVSSIGGNGVFAFIVETLSRFSCAASSASRRPSPMRRRSPTGPRSSRCAPSSAIRRRT